MAGSPRDDQSTRDYEEISPRDPPSDLNASNNPPTIRDFQTKLEDLNRENFNLKLRIFFLEQNESNGQNSSSTPIPRPRPSTQYESVDRREPFLFQQTDDEHDQQRSPTRRLPNIPNNSETDEQHFVRTRNGRDHDTIRRPFRHSGESGEYVPTLNLDPTTQTYLTTPSVDSNLGSTMPTSTYNLQLEERERKLQDENNSLKKENTSLKARLNDISEQYRTDMQNSEDKQAKAERVIKRMKADYDARIANLEEEQRQKSAEYQSYRHEQEQTNSNVNIEEYLRKIDQQDRLITQLNERLSGTNAYQPKPHTVLLPSSIDPQAIDENTRRLKEYAETIDQLRAECDELRRSEKFLRRQVEELNRLFEPSNGRLPPLPRSSIVDDTEQVDDPQSAIVHTSLQLRQDAENISGLTNRIAQIIRDREDNQNKLKDKDAQIRQYETRESEFENRTTQKFDLQIEGLQHDIQHLEKQIENRDRRLKELADDNVQLRSQPRRDDPEIENRYSRISDDLRQELDREHQEYDTLRRDYERVKSILDSSNVESLEETIQQQEKQIEKNQTQIQELENNLEQQRIHLEREKDFEKGKADQIQNELDAYKRRVNDLQNQYDKVRPILDEQHTKYEKQIRTYQTELAQAEQEREDLNEELQLLRYEKESAAKQTPENDPKFIELVRANQEFKDQISRYEVRFHDHEDETKRYQNELNRLQDIHQTTIQQYDELQVNHVQTQDELASVASEKDQVQTDNQTLNTENTKLKHDINELEIRIRLEINQEYENKYQGRLNNLTERKDTEIDNVLREKETMEFELERVNHERTRFENQVNQMRDELQNAHETIENYEEDLQRLREDLNKSKENNDQIKRQISEAYAEKFKEQNDRIQELEEQLQVNQSSTNHDDERHSPRDNRSSNLYEEINSEDNGRYEKRLSTPNNQELIYQLESKLREQDDVITSLRNSRATGDGEPRDIELELQIRIHGLEQDLEKKERFIHEYSDTIQARDEQIENLLENLQQGDSSQAAALDTLREEIENRNRRIDEILDEKNSEIDQRERHIAELQLAIKDRERRLAETEERLGEAEQKIDEQQLEIDDLNRKTNRLTIAPEDRETYLSQIQDLEKELAMEKKTTNATPSEQRDQYQNVIDDLKARIRQRDDSIQKLQRSLRDSDEQLKDTRQDQNKMAGDINRLHRHNDQMASDVENRDQTIASLRQKLSEKDQEINKLHENNLAKEQKLNELYGKMIPDELDLKRGGERAPSNVVLKIELQKKEQEINDLKKRLDEAQHEKPDQTDLATTSSVPRARPRSGFDHLNREELLFELNMALQHNEDLNEQLRKKFPTITELHSQLVEVRNELARQKYVNQVLWRKLNALIDIHGANTRSELASELANYQDELNKLKSQHTRTNDARSVILNAHSRSSSEQNLSTLSHGVLPIGQQIPSKNIRSTIALLERSNIEWQTKLARMTEQLGRNESQSRNYQRELIKYQKLLYDAGLTESTIRQRRRSADDSVIIGLNDSNIIKDDLTEIDNLNQLKEIIRNQRKYNQQLQTRIRLNTPDIIQSPMTEKLNEQIHNLNLVIETYNTESDLLKKELKKLYKTIEYHRNTSQQYEQLIKDQQLSLDQSKKKLTKYDQLLKKYDILDETTKEHFLDEYIIDLDIDIIPTNDKKKKTSLGKKDSGHSSATDATEQQRQIREKDDQIKDLNNQLKERDEQIQQLADELNNSKKNYEDVGQQTRTDYERVRRDLTDQIRETQNELQEARSQLDTLKTSRPQYKQVEEQNQQLLAEIEHLQDELERQKPLLEHYKTQIEILERRSPAAIHDNDASEMVIRSSELSQLLEEMRLLRRDLERSLQKQNELQAKLDENIRQSQSPREFTFTGRGVSYPDLRLVDSSGLMAPENLSRLSPIHGKHSRPVDSSSTDLDHIEYPQLSNRESERPIPTKSYSIGEIRTRKELRKLIEDVKYDLKALGQELNDKLRPRTNASITDAFVRSIEERLLSLDERLTHALDLIDTYWRAELPERNKDDEHIFVDQRLLEENKHLLMAQRKYMRDAQMLREKYKEQSSHLEQLLAQLTKSNRKKADTGEYLALLLRPTLDVLQKARSNIENHLKESNTNHVPPGSAQSQRRHRSNHHE